MQIKRPHRIFFLFSLCFINNKTKRDNEVILHGIGYVIKLYRITEWSNSRMGHSVKVSLWCVKLLINTRFRFFLILE